MVAPSLLSDMSIANERDASRAILESGVKYRVPVKGMLGIFTKELSFTIKQPNAGTLIKISEIISEIDLDFEKLQNDTIYESYQIAGKELPKVTRIIAIAILGGKWKIRLFTGILTNWLLWRVTPEKILQLAEVLFTLNNTLDFLNSIRLIRGTRMTAPKENLSPADQGG
jgi:hypothetical protein